MKIVSEKTGKQYNNVEDCLADEKQFDEKIAKEEERKKELANERKNRAKEVEEAYKAKVEANVAYNKILSKFIEDYGSFHMTINNLSDLWDKLWF